MRDSSKINTLLADYMGGIEDDAVLARTEELFSEIRHEIEERDGLLKDYVDILEDGSVKAKINPLTDWHKKYEDMRQRYIDRWKTGDDKDYKPVDGSEGTDAKPQGDDEPETLPMEDLFVEKESE